LNARKLLLFVVNDPAFFLSHRVAIALKAKENGYDVHVATAFGDSIKEIIMLGFVHHEIFLTRSGVNPFLEFRSLFNLYKLYGRLHPDIVHLVTIKPVLYGGLIARIKKIPATVAAISGLGSVFVATSNTRKIMKFFVLLIYRLALSNKNIKVIFQNQDDKNKLISAKVIEEKNSTLIRGSGVDLSLCPVTPEPEGPPIVVMASRLLKEKGVLVFVEAAKIIKSKGINAKFHLIGSPDHGNPSSVTVSEINSWVTAGLIEAFGFRTDIPKIFSNSHIVTLPSFYGEGLPKVLIEAAACARPVVTTDNPGCRDAIEDGITGILIPINDAAALANSLEKLILDKESRIKMGAAGRDLAEREFTIESVVKMHLHIYEKLLKNE